MHAAPIVRLWECTSTYTHARGLLLCVQARTYIPHLESKHMVLCVDPVLTQFG